MKLKNIMFCIPVFSFFLSLCSCQKNPSFAPPRAQKLRLSMHSEPPSLDPRKAGDTTSITIIKMCFEGLTRMDAQGQPTFALAESAEFSEDQLHIRLFLRKSYWSDGLPVTAYDFEESWKTILDPAFPSYISENLYIIQGAKEAKEGLLPLDEVGVKATDEKTLEITLKHPVPHLLELLSTSSFFPTPSHITKNSPHWAEHSGPLFVTNGPFLLTSWRHYNNMEFVKNPTYWNQGVVRLEKITLLMIEDENTELAMFENGELDWAGFPLSNLPIDALASLEKQEKIYRYPLSGTYFYLFNTTIPPFTNKNIRKAFALAIDRTAIIDNILQGKQVPATGLIPPLMWKKNLSYFKDGDVHEARRLFALGLEELGISKENLPPVTLTYNTLQSHHKIAQAIQQQWFEAFGIRVRLENKEWKVYLDEISKKQFQVARMGGIASVSDPVYFLDNYKYTQASRNFTGWSHPEFTEKLDQACQCREQEQRLSFLQQAETLLMEEMPVIPLYFYTGSYLKKPYVQQVVVGELSDIDFTWSFVQEPL